MRSRPVLARWLAIGLGVLALVLVSSAFGRAEPTGNYRPPLSPDALTNGCYPLPDGMVLDFPAQVRTDGDVTTADGPRRELVVQWDLRDRDEVVASLDETLAAAGWTEVGELAWEKDGERISATATDLPDLPDDSIVRGTVVLDLPVADRASDDPVCDDPYSTKRFPPELEQLS